MCENLYTGAAKCNRHIGGASSESYQSSEQEDNSQTVCNYISSVVSGRYDEDGFIYADTRQYRKDNGANQYAKSQAKQVVTAGQIVLIFFLSIAFICLSIVSCVLRNAITKKAVWRGPNRDMNAALAAQISRQNSGIGMNRSTSFVQIH